MNQLISKSQIITWLITVGLFLTGLMVTGWVNLNSRVRVLEIQVSILNTQMSIVQENSAEAVRSIKKVEMLIHEVDKKIVALDTERQK